MEQFRFRIGSVPLGGGAHGGWLSQSHFYISHWLGHDLPKANVANKTVDDMDYTNGTEISSTIRVIRGLVSATRGQAVGFLDYPFGEILIPMR